MTRSVTLTTPVTTWEETAEHYGLSKADRKFVAGLFAHKAPRRSNSKALPASSKAGLFEAKRSSGRVRKTNSRARKAA